MNSLDLLQIYVPRPGQPAGSAAVCPGGLVRLEGLDRYVRAFRAHDKGELTTFFPSPDNALLEGVEALALSASTLEAYEISAMKVRR